MSKALEFLFENLPQNRPLYKDSGLWQIRADDMNNNATLYQLFQLLDKAVLPFVNDQQEAEKLLDALAKHNNWQRRVKPTLRAPKFKQ